MANGDSKRDSHNVEPPDTCTGSPSGDSPLNTAAQPLDKEQPKKLTLLDLFRNKRLLYNAMIMWTAW